MLKKIVIFLLLSILMGYLNVYGEESNTNNENDSNTENQRCENPESCLSSPDFIIKVNDISPGMDINGDKDTVNNINFALGVIIQKLMIALGSLSLLIMIVGAGYIILHHGQDELLSKGKSIFMSGIYALIVALSSYYIIAIIRFVLFQ